MSKKNFITELHDIRRRLFSQEPASVISQWNESQIMWRSQLTKIVFGAFELEGMPDFWDRNYFYERLFLDGELCITDTSMGIIPLQCGHSGLNVWYKPTTCNIANSVLGSFSRTIGADCALVQLQYNFGTINPILEIYSYLIAAAESSISVNLMNTKTPFIMECENQSQFKTLATMYDDINQGKPAVFVKSGNGSSFFQLRPKESYIADSVYDLKEKILNEFRKMWGINTANTNKKERLVSTEVEYSNGDVPYNIQHIIECVQCGLDVANKLYDMKLRFKRRVFKDGSSDINESLAMGRNNI